jgi:hypothetical protein
MNRIRHQESAFIVFRPGFRLEKADDWLSSAHLPGYRGLVHSYRLIPAVLAHVDPEHVDEFLRRVRAVDWVLLAHPNYPVTPASFDRTVAPRSRWAELSSSTVRRHHGFSRDSLAGQSVNVAVVDSGMASHPYLPATGFIETRARLLVSRPDIYGSYDRFIEPTIDKLAQAESTSPLRAPAVASQVDAYVGNIDAELRACDDAIWSDWESKYRRWQAGLPLGGLQSRQGPSATAPAHQHLANMPRTGAVGLPSAGSPPYPVTRNLLGTLRQLDFRSRCFLSGTLDIDDTCGHGTEMLGIMAASDPLSGSPHAAVHAAASAFAVDVPATSPAAQYLVLRCYDKHELDYSHLATVVEALEYAQLARTDLIYIGLTWNPDTPWKQANALTSVLDQLRALGVLVVCPAGNVENGPVAGLAFPAAARSTVAVTALSRGGDDLASFSRFADKGEEVEFCAQGEAVLTTGLNFGFEEVRGTSVAAALATGLLARAIGEYRITQIRNQYYSGSVSRRALRTVIRDAAGFGIDSLLKDARARCRPTRFPDQSRVGSGCIRGFP